MEFDEKGHRDRQKGEDDERQEKAKNELDCKFIRINLGGKDFDE